MIKPDTLNTNNYSSKSQKFDDLLRDGISFIQQFSGKNWTDYNYHDPGITILEQLCFAITDMGYKSHFEIEDIMMYGIDDFDFEKHNLFIPPEKIFSSSAATINDYRKIIIDSVSEVDNAWIDFDLNNTNNISGLFNVKLQLKENCSDEIIKYVVEQTEIVLSQSRALCTDLNKIIILNKDIISIACDVIIDSFCVGEEILAKIFIGVEQRINERIRYVNLEDFDDLNVSTDHLFEGVKTKNGIIHENSLKEKTNQIYVSELIEIIRNIGGVLNIKNFKIFKNGIRIFDDIISFSENSYPALENFRTYFSDLSDGQINFLRNNTRYDIDETIFAQIHDSLIEKEFQHLNNIKYQNQINSGRFTKNRLSKYYSVINEFPTIYGLKEKELPASSSDLRVSQMRQLKAYLLLYDQLMNNYLAQLVNLRELFSIQKSDRTFYTAVPNDVHGLWEIIKNSDLDSYSNNIQRASEDSMTFVNRRNTFLDHILLRFGETFDSEILKKIYQENNPDFEELDCESYAINCKTEYLNQMTILGKNRNKGINYRFKDHSFHSISGLEMRLRLLLDIDFNSSETDFNAQSKNKISLKEKNKWSVKQIEINNGPLIDVLSLSDSCYKKGEVNFYLKNYSHFDEILIYGIKRKSYRIISNGASYLLLYNSNTSEYPVKIFESDNRSDCKIKINDIRTRLGEINKKSENILIIENILLRPLNSDRYSLKVSTNSNQHVFKSPKLQEFNKLVEIRDDLNLILSDRSNYTIHKSTQNAKLYLISVYDIMDQKILISSELFESKNKARNFIDHFIDKLLMNSDFEIDINSEEAVSNTFPDSFNFSNELNIVFPSWPNRFQNIEFKKYIEQVVNDFTPAHIRFNLLYLNFKNFNDLSKSWNNWKDRKLEGDENLVDIASLQVIQFLLKSNNV